MILLLIVLVIILCSCINSVSECASERSDLRTYPRINPNSIILISSQPEIVLFDKGEYSDVGSCTIIRENRNERMLNLYGHDYLNIQQGKFYKKNNPTAPPAYS